jgi:hypothetical protein
MPVSKKRKKDGKPVHRTEPADVQVAEHAHGPEAKPAAPPLRSGKPSNPFVAARPQVRGAQRGR